MKALRLTALVALTISTLSCGDSADPLGRDEETDHPKLIILGFDGFDYGLAREMMASGDLPNLSSLANEGSFQALETSVPPQSPVAWSNFITGVTPGTHGIFDFVHRDPKTLTPYLSTSEVEEAPFFDIGSFRLPLGSGGVSLLRDAPAFWEGLREADIPVRVIKAPANFPPAADKGARSVSGMGTPDLLGTYGTFTLLTSDPRYHGHSMPGGRIAPILLEEPSRETGKATLTGPPHPFRSDARPLTAEVEVAVDATSRGVVVAIGDARILVAEGEWSDWLTVEFEVIPWVYSVRGMVRILAKELSPEVTLYLSPINIDPTDPALPVSSPEEFATALAERSGRFYTQGMPEDTKAFEEEVLDAREFLDQGRVVYEERKALFDTVLSDLRGGLLFYYFSSSDPHGHMFWREHDPAHLGHAGSDKEYEEVIRDIYRELDGVVGEVRATLGPDDALIVMSDHGFAPYSRSVHLNAWLLENGYLAVRTDGSRGEGPLGHIDWSGTRAYALGFNGLYLNLAGREKHGIVGPESRDALLAELGHDLLAAVDPDTGQRLVTNVYRTDRDMPGPHLDRAPDILVGYARGYRSSGSSALGEVDARIVERNTDQWSGDHCIDHRLVPGVLYANIPSKHEAPSLYDLGPSVLAFYGLPIPERFVGSPIWDTGPLGLASGRERPGSAP